MTLLILSAFAAGFVDSIVGGGGLIQLPALFVFLPPDLAGVIPAVMGTNKFASICGTAVATFQYLRKVTLPAVILAPAAISAFAFSFLGARTVSLLNPKIIRPLILILLVSVALYTIFRKRNAPVRTLQLPAGWRIPMALTIGSVIGFYDGFFGPGTGTFLIISFVVFFGFDFLRASASAKVVNLSTNLAAILWFMATGNIHFHYAIPMAAANIAGAMIGSRLAILKGSEFVRKFFIIAVFLLIARFAWEIALGK